MSTVPAVALRGVTKRFGASVAVEPTDLDVADGEFFSILGPSGCGKTTIMRMIAGFESPTAGTISLDGRDVVGVPTRKRDLNMLFQSYALFPHLSVEDNVAFELRTLRVPRAELRDRVAAALDLVQLGEFRGRKPQELSGGQRQRVALARAVVGRPKVVLLDEPLGALDQRLRKDMQFELKRMQRELGITFIYVTHDQEEALTMSDRIAVMSRGRVLQVGSPTEIYDEPANRFVASFIGTCNLLDASAADGAARVEGVGVVPASPETDGAVVVAVRPERIRLLPADAAQGIPGRVVEHAFLGDHWLAKVVVGAAVAPVQVQVPASVGADLLRGLEDGAEVRIDWSPADARVLPAEVAASAAQTQEVAA